MQTDRSERETGRTPQRPPRAGRRCAAVALAAAMTLTAAACSDAPAPSTDQAPKAQGAGGGTAVVGVTTDPDTLFPWKATQFQAVNVLQNLYGTLTEFDENLKVVPGLAESWEPSGDGRTLTLKLRKGVKFTDGSDFDAEDVKSSLDRIRDPKTAAVARTSLASVDSVEVTDPQTVTLKLKNADASLPANLASVNLAMLSTTDSEETLRTKPNGTGPFTFDTRTPSQSITVKRNDSYWRGKVPLDKVEFRVIPDENAIVSAMQSNNVQLAVINDPLVAKNASGSVHVLKTPQLNYHALQLQATKGALTDVNVRLAIQCAIDRQQVLDAAALGEGEVTGPITSPNFRSDPAARPCPKRDVAKAKEYLAKAGKQQVAVKTIVSQGEYATSVNEAQSLKAQLAEAGIDLQLEVLESGTFVKRWTAADFEAAVALNGGRPDPDGAYSRYFTSTGNLNKVAGYSSPKLDELFAKGRSTSDEAQRKAIYKDVSAELENNAAWIWMFTGFTYTATTDKVGGFTPMATGGLQSLRSTTVN